MRRWKIIPVFTLSALLASPMSSSAQSQEAQQLVLNVIKLAQLKKILTDLYQGYEIVSKGYGAIKGISEGNFNLHKTFLDGLLAVNPQIAKYNRVADIARYQLTIVKEYKSAYTSFSQSGNFSAEELTYMASVYSNLFSKSLQNLESLLMVITSSRLRMSDAERLTSIDRIFTAMEDQLTFLRSFNAQAKMLGLQRKQAKQDVNSSKQLYNLK